MDFENACWDCPIPVWKVLPVFAIGLALAVLAAFLLTRSHVAIRAAGTATAIIALLWYVLGALGAWRFGV